MPLVVAWKLVLPRPFLDLQRIAVRSAIAIVTISVSFLQELLVLALQVVFEDDAVNVRALVTEAFGFLHVGAIELRVMLQLAWLLDALWNAWRSRESSSRRRDSSNASLLRQRDDSVIAVESDGLHQP